MTDIVWSNVTVTLGQLKPWEQNPKSISKSHAKRLLASWDKFGQFQTVAIGPGFEVYDGHQRLSVLRAAFGDGYQVAARQSSRELTDSERRELVIAAHVGTTGQFDWDELANWDAAELQEWGLDGETLQDWKTGIGALTELIEAAKPEPAEDAGAQIDKAEELREKWGVETGQMWRLGEHRIICGDCTDKAVVERVMGGEKADICFTDPPYGVKRDEGFEGSEGFGGFGTPIARRQYADDWDSERPSKEQFDFMLSCASNSIFWGGNYYADILPKSTHWIVWDKNNTMPTFGDCELAWTSLNRKSVKKYEITYNGLIGKEKERYHPTQKPEALFTACLADYSKEGETIIDFYLGSGTTLIACERLGRKCRAVEISPGYVAVAIQRWVDMTGGTPELIQ